MVLRVQVQAASDKLVNQALTSCVVRMNDQPVQYGPPEQASFLQGCNRC